MPTIAFSWDDKGTWPSDSPEYVFLARAVDALGQKLLGIEWTGKEISAEGGAMPLEFRAASVWASNQAQEWSRALILKYAPASTIQEASRLDCEARDRFVRVTREITAHCVWGRLVAAARWDNGSFGEMHRDRWNNPKSGWFARCHVPATEAFNQSWGGKDYLPIFIRRIELDGMTGAAGAPVPVQVIQADPVPELYAPAYRAALVGQDARPIGKPPAGVRNRPSEQQDLVKPYLEKMFPGGIPAMSRANLVRVVSAAMERDYKAKSLAIKAPSRETILRAAGLKS